MRSINVAELAWHGKALIGIGNTGRLPETAAAPSTASVRRGPDQRCFALAHRRPVVVRCGGLPDNFTPLVR
jgi:hypothetical protein